MNQLLDQMATMPFTIACLFAVVMMIIALRGDTRNARQKIMITWLEKENEQRLETISEVNMELAKANDEVDRLSKNRDIDVRELEELKRQREMAWEAGRAVSNNLITAATRLQKLEYILKKVHPQIYDDKRLDAWIDRLRNKGKNSAPVPPAITREARQGAETAREIRRAGR